MKNFKAHSVFHGKRKLLKSWMIKIYSIQKKILGQTLFFRASASCWKILNDKKYILSTVKKFRARSVFQGKRKLLKNPECKKYIQYSEKLQGKRKLLKNLDYKNIFNTVAHSFFRASASCSKILNDKKYIFNTAKNFRTNSVFQGKCKLLKTKRTTTIKVK